MSLLSNNIPYLFYTMLIYISIFYLGIDTSNAEAVISTGPHAIKTDADATFIPPKLDEGSSQTLVSKDSLIQSILNSPTAALTRARYYYLYGDIQQVLPILEEYLQPGVDQKSNDFVYAMAAQVAYEQGLWTKAALYYEKAQSGLPEISDYLAIKQARSYFAAQQYGKSKQILNDLMKNQHSNIHISVTSMLADVAFAEGDWQHAMEYYSVLRSSEGWVSDVIRYNIAYAQEQLGAYEQAAQTYQKIFHEMPFDVLGIQANKKLQLLLTEHNIQVPELSVDELMSFAKQYSRRRHLKDATSIYTNLSKRTTGIKRAEIMLRIAEITLRQRKYYQAQGKIDALLRKPQGLHKAEILYVQARLYSAKGEFEKAIKVYKRIWKSWSNHEKARHSIYKAAWLAYEVNDFQLAQEFFKLYIKRYKRDERSADVLWHLAWTNFLSGNFDECREFLLQLESINHQDVLIHQKALYWYARSFMEQGQDEKAIEAFKKFQKEYQLGYYSLLVKRQLEQLYAHARPYIGYVDGSKKNSLDMSPHELPDYTGALEPVPLMPQMDYLNKIDLLSAYKVTQSFSSLKQWRRIVSLGALGLEREVEKELEILEWSTQLQSKESYWEKALLAYDLNMYNTAFRLVRRYFLPQSNLQLPTNDKRKYWLLTYPLSYQALVEHYGQLNGVSPLLLLAVIRQESAYLPYAKSWANARGLMQIIPITGRRIARRVHDINYEVSDLYEPAVNIRYGSWYIRELLEKFYGNVFLAVGSYNAGPRAMVRWVKSNVGLPLDVFVEKIPYRETRGYIKRVVGAFHVYRYLYARHTDIPIADTITLQYKENINF